MISRRSSRPGGWLSPRLALLAGACLVAAIADPATAAEPGLPPSRLFPSRGLRAYAESDGLAAHAAAWDASAARAILEGTTAGATIADVARSVTGRIFQAAAFSEVSADDLLAARGHLARAGFAWAVYEEDDEASMVVVLPGLGEKAARDRFGRVYRSLLRLGAASPPAPVRVRGRDLHGWGEFGGVKPPAPPAEAAPATINLGDLLNAPGRPDGLTWWLEGDCLILVQGPSTSLIDAISRPDRARKDLPAMHRARVEGVLDAIDGRAPAVGSLPAFAAATAEGRDLPGFEPCGLFLAEGKEARGVLDDLGRTLGSSGEEQVAFDEFTLFRAADLARANRVVGRWGFRGKSLVTDVRFEVPSPWQGYLGRVDRRGFARAQLPPIPANSGAFAVAAIGRAEGGDDLASLRLGLKPEARVFLEAAERTIAEATTPPLREALLRHLGPTWSAYAAPGSEGTASPVVLVGFDDAGAVDQALGDLASAINAWVRKRSGDPERPAALAIERMPAPDRGYRLASPAGVVPWLTEARRPTILIGRSFLAVAANLALARQAIDAESGPETRPGPAGELARSLEALPAKLSFLSVGNPRDSAWPEAVARLRETARAFASKFLQIDLDGDPPAESAPDLLDLIGVPRGSGVRPEPPGADALRALIYPSVLAATIDERSFRVIALEALPLACVGFEPRFHEDGSMKVEVKFAPGR